MNNSLIRLIAFILVIIGALNWGLVGLFDFDLVKNLFGYSYISRTIYLLVAFSGLYLTFQSFLNEGILKIYPS